MTLRLLAWLGALFALIAVGTLLIRGLIWLLERFDPALPVQQKAAARARAIEATLLAVRLGLLGIPRVFPRQKV